MKKFSPYIAHIVLTLVFILVTTLAYLYIPNLDSNLYLAIVTFLVGLSAFYLYTKQQQDTKKEIANIIVSEIRFAEARISEYKRLGIRVSFFMEPILPNNTWSKHHHLYINDLDPIDEYPLLRDFYNKCTLLDRSLEMVSSSSQLEQKADAMYKGLSHIAENISESITAQLSRENLEQITSLYRIRAETFLGTFTKDGTAYNPDAPRQVSTAILQQIQPIMNTPAGEKLKRIAGVK